MKQFGAECEELYGCQEIMPNMHSHLHLRSQIYDFGPIYSIWNLNFERYNGLLKNINTNYKDSFETTYMRGFLELGFADNFIVEKSQGLAAEPDFMKILIKLAPQLSPPPIDPTINASQFDLNTFVNYAEKWNGNLEVSGWEPLPPSSYPLDIKQRIPISDNHYRLLLAYYRYMYPNNIFKSYHIEDIDAAGEMVADLIQKMPSIKILGQLYRSDEARSKKGIHIQALFEEGDNNGNPVIREGRRYTEMRYGRIAYFFVHRVRLVQDCDSDYFDHTFAFVDWYAKSSDVASIAAQRSHGLMECCTHFRRMTWECILPVHCIFSLIAVAPNSPDKLVVIPLPRKTTG